MAQAAEAGGQRDQRGAVRRAGRHRRAAVQPRAVRGHHRARRRRRQAEPEGLRRAPSRARSRRGDAAQAGRRQRRRLHRAAPAAARIPQVRALVERVQQRLPGRRARAAARRRAPPDRLPGPGLRRPLPRPHGARSRALPATTAAACCARPRATSRCGCPTRTRSASPRSRPARSRFERVRGEVARAGRPGARDQRVHASAPAGDLRDAARRPRPLADGLGLAAPPGRALDAARAAWCSTSSLRGYLMLRAVAGMKRWRRSTTALCRREPAHRGVAGAHRATPPRINPALAVEVAQCQRLVKGYSDTHERGLRNYETVMARGAARRRSARAGHPARAARRGAGRRARQQAARRAGAARAGLNEETHADVARSTATLQLRVVEARELNPLIRTLRLQADDGAPLPGFTAGAHIRVQVDAARRHARLAPLLADQPRDASRRHRRARRVRASRCAARTTAAAARASCTSACRKATLLTIEPPKNDFPLHAGTPARGADRRRHRRHAARQHGGAPRRPRARRCACTTPAAAAS